jgi:phage replication initiation protein
MAAKTHVDWFAFRGKDTPDVMAAALGEVVPDGLSVSLAPRKTGWRSFEKSFDVWLTDDRRGRPDEDCARVGMAMTGGDAVKGWSMFSLSGEGCAWVKDWSRVMDVCTDQIEAFELKRVDVALDRFDGSHWHDVDDAWKAGDFCPPSGGKKPKAKPIDSRRPEDGRTYYVGNRESAKFYRGYEKGMQLLGPQMVAAQDKDPEAFDLAEWLLREDVRVVLDDGGEAKLQRFHLRDWWRDEVEFKPVDNPLPLDLIDNRDEYFAGAYPYLAKVLPTAVAHPLITRRERMPQLELRKVLETLRHQYGNSLFTALHAYHGDIGAVWDRIVGKKHNAALVAAGVLLVDHG